MKWSPFAKSTWQMLSFLECGSDGHGSWAIHASKRGLRLTLQGITVARGADPDALMHSYDVFAEQSRKAVEEAHKR
jgi:hypothetical protein